MSIITYFTTRETSSKIVMVLVRLWVQDPWGAYVSNNKKEKQKKEKKKNRLLNLVGALSFNRSSISTHT